MNDGYCHLKEAFSPTCILGFLIVLPTPDCIFVVNQHSNRVRQLVLDLQAAQLSDKLSIQQIGPGGSLGYVMNRYITSPTCPNTLQNVREETLSFYRRLNPDHVATCEIQCHGV